jgi:hypothetical protein
MDVDSDQGDTAPNQNLVTDVTNILEGVPKRSVDDIEQRRAAPADDESKGGDADKTPGGDTDKSDSSTGLDSQGAPLDSSDADENDKPVTLKELAESMEIETKDLYDVEITVGKDETATLGELKDGYRELEKLRGDHEQFETRKTTQENEVMVAKRQIEQLIDIGVRTNSLHPEILTRLESIHGENVGRERRAVLSAIPEWSNDIERSKDFEQMHELLSGYGFSRSEVDGVLDHRLLKFTRDMAKRENQIKHAKVKDDPIPKSTGKSKRASVQTKLQAKVRHAKTPSATRNEKLSAISDLLN